MHKWMWTHATHFHNVSCYNAFTDKNSVDMDFYDPDKHAQLQETAAHGPLRPLNSTVLIFAVDDDVAYYW